MRGPLAVALAVFLALAPVVVVVSAVPAGSAVGYAPGASGTASGPGLSDTTRAPVVSDANTTEYLALPSDDVQMERFETTRIDVSGALAADAGRLDAAFTRRWFDRAYAAADTDAERRLVLGLAADRVEERIDALQTREREALEAFNARDLSTSEYLRKLAVIHAGAGALQPVVGQLRDSIEDVEDSPVTEQQLDSFEAQLLALRGPVRDRVGQALSGDLDEPPRVYVETSSTGVVLAVVDDGRYIREAYLASARVPGASDQFEEGGRPIDEVQSRFQELYSWAATNSLSQSFGNAQLDDAAVYPVTVSHPHGTLTTYLDGGTTDAFLERQRKDLSGVPTDASVASASSGLRLQVNRTHVGGPLEVRVLDSSTGEPVDARITVNDVPLGRTGADGRLWTIAPPARFSVEATADGRRVSVRTFSRRKP